MSGVLDLRAAGIEAMRVKPRFIGLQEVDQLAGRVGGADTCAILAEATGMHATFAKAIDFDGGEYGVALLSRGRPLAVRRIPLPGDEPRVLLLCRFRDCWVGVTHLDVASEETRLAAVPIVRDAVARCAVSKPVFLMGDWNAPPSSPTLKAMRGFMDVLSDETMATFHGENFTPGDLCDPSRCIDYIAIDKGHRASFTLRSSRVIEERTISDHAPIAVDVTGKRE